MTIASLLANESILRLSIFVAVLLLLAIAEQRWPRRKRNLSRAFRWTGNLGIAVLNTLVTRLTIPAATIGLALQIEKQNIGPLQLVPLPGWIAITLGVVLLDLAVYWQHRMFHLVPALWRLHRLHHTDLEFDVSTALRFHPVEILLSMVIKLTLVFALGVPAMAALIFEILLNASAMFNHANLRLPVAVDQLLRWLLVTPDMHRVHHSVIHAETNSNFGFCLPWWDRIFRSYIAQPQAGHEAMTIGLQEFRTLRDQRLDRMLMQPFV